ncbi:hypothetical protein MGYG_08485 [Nannizzia gypsea CBS 118893]|uniref:Uncharacterized protein n=1 Tax=Arthroderma gypseum (strain ATCC MYA-4604 / CBS 118893) TaxID=535722 RepID=E4V5U7_ARTGP|nr:hypothetical protein MGYG_08485 [Nannizzia gypsea CBS 118893]EFR05472.1 hypothetical protein MGYG_08485 [Nannizzia gypsea CBS 118893]
MAPLKRRVKATSESLSSEFSGSPALTHATSNPSVSSPPSDSKPQIMSKEDRHQVFQEHLKKIESMTQEELVEFLKKAGHWDRNPGIPYDTDDDTKYEKGEKIA